MRYQGYRRRHWRRRGGLVGFPFMLLFMIFLFSHAISGFLVIIGAMVLLGLLARLILPAIFGAGMMGTAWKGSQQTYQPYEASYQPYDQGYQPPVTPYRKPEANQQYRAPSYDQAHYEEQPQAQYPQEMPPMHQ